MLDTAIIPCGGLGRRLHPITRWVPKEMLPVGLQPLLYRALDEVAEAGLQRAILITTPSKPMLESAARQYQGMLELEFIPQDRPRGPGDALLRARDHLGNAPFFILLPDNLLHGENQSRAVLDLHRRTRLATVLLADAGTALSCTRASTAAADDGTLRVTDVVEVPRGTDGVMPVGRFALAGGMLDEFEEVSRTLAPGSELTIAPALRRLARRGALAGVRSTARFFDAGTPEGYHDAVRAFPARG